MSQPTRRQVLEGLTAVAASSTLPGCTPPRVPSETGSPLDTFVVLMMENRSFDHYFGALSLEEGRTDVDGLRPGLSNPDAEGNPVEPFHLPYDCLEDPPHGWGGSHDQFADGANSGFVLAHQGGRTAQSRDAIGYYTREELGVFYALADEHALPTRWFASVMSSTWPNRFYSYCGTSAGYKSNDFSAVPFPHPSIFDQLTEHGVTWAIYVTEVPFAALLEGIVAFPDGANIRSLDQFFVDAENGQLPQVCFVEPGYTFNDDHPPHPIALGQVLVGTVYQALATSPHWDRCLFVVDYDEHGGFFDHVAPPKVEDDHAEDGFDQLGFRIPALVVGPYTRAAAIETRYDHTSVLKHLQNHFGMPSLSLRNETANDLSDCLDADRMAARDPKPPTVVPAIAARREDFGSECFYSFADAPGQPELEALADAGFIPPRWDFRDQREETLSRLFDRAEKLGVFRDPGA